MQQRGEWKFLCVGLVVVACSGALVCGLSGSGRPLLGSSGKATKARAPAPVQASSAAFGGIEARESDAANLMVLEWPPVENMDRGVLAAADQAIDVQAQFDAGAAELLPTMLAVNSPSLLAYERQRCADAFGHEITSACVYTLTNVMERTDDGEASVVFSRATLHSGSGPECDQYVGCVARARLGAKIAVPANAGELTGFAQHVVSKPVPEHLKDPAAIKNLVAILEADAKDAREQGVPSDDYRLEYSVLMQEEMIRYMKQKVEDLSP